MDRVLRNTSPLLDLFLYDGTGAPFDPAGGITNATLKDSSGTTVGTLTVSHPGTGDYQVQPSAAQTNPLDVYSITWNLADGTTRTTEFETVGGFYFSVAQLRAFEAKLTAALFPAWLVAEGRDGIEERFEREMRVAWVPRGRRVLVDGLGYSSLHVPDMYPRTVVSASIGGVALTSAELADLQPYPTGKITRKTTGIWPQGHRNVALFYEHGLDEPPRPVRRAAMRACRYELLKSPIEANDRATAQFTDVGAFRLTIAGRDGPFGLPEVDAVIAQFGKLPSGDFA